MGGDSNSRNSKVKNFGGWGGGEGTQTPEISKVRNSISCDSLDHVYLRAFLFSIRKKKKKKKNGKKK